MANVTLPYDPNLKEAVAEIRAILERRGIGGTLGLASPTHAEFANIFPPWSVIQEVTGGVRIYSKHEDYPNFEAQHEAAEATAHLVMRMIDCLAKDFHVWDLIRQKIEEHWTIEHETGSFVPDQR